MGWDTVFGIALGSACVGVVIGYALSGGNGSIDDPLDDLGDVPNIPIALIQRDRWVEVVRVHSAPVTERSR